MLIHYGARVTQVEGKEQRNKETEQCDVVGAPGAIRCKKLRQSLRIAGFGADNHSLYRKWSTVCLEVIHLFWFSGQQCLNKAALTPTHKQQIIFAWSADQFSLTVAQAVLMRVCILVKSACYLRNVCPRVPDFREILSLKPLLKSVQKKRNLLQSDKNEYLNTVYCCQWRTWRSSYTEMVSGCYDRWWSINIKRRATISPVILSLSHVFTATVTQYIRQSVTLLSSSTLSVSITVWILTGSAGIHVYVRPECPEYCSHFSRNFKRHLLRDAWKCAICVAVQYESWQPLNNPAARSRFHKKKKSLIQRGCWDLSTLTCFTYRVSE